MPNKYIIVAPCKNGGNTRYWVGPDGKTFTYHREEATIVDEETKNQLSLYPGEKWEEVEDSG